MLISGQKSGQIRGQACGMKRQFADKSADRAVSLPPSDVMGIYVAAVVAGFRGMYRDNPQGLQSWLHAHGNTLFWQVHRDPPPPTSPDLPGAPPLRGTSLVLLRSLLTTLLFISLVISFWWAFGLR